MCIKTENKAIFSFHLPSESDRFHPKLTHFPACVGKMWYIVVAIVIYLFIQQFRVSRNSAPVAQGWFPIVGHAFSFGKDIIGFVRAAYRKHGSVFSVQIFRKKLLVVADPNLLDEFFRAQETDASLYSALEDLYFADAFFRRESEGDRRQSEGDHGLESGWRFRRAINLLKRTIVIQHNTFAPKIFDEAQIMIERLKRSPTPKQVNLKSEMSRYISRTTAACFVGIELSDNFMHALELFSERVNKLVVMTYLIPPWLLRYFYEPQLKVHRDVMIAELAPLVQKYRSDPHLNDSRVIRVAVDSQLQLTDRDIAEALITLLYVGSENTALGMVAAVADLAEHPHVWEQVKEEGMKYAQEGQLQEVVRDSQLLEGCMLESARLNSHIFPLARVPAGKTTLGKWSLDGIDVVAVCPPLLMRYEGATASKAQEYLPYRDRTDAILTWGAGIHKCPGMVFAKWEIKAGLALLAMHFAAPKLTQIGNINYFSPSAFAERPLETSLVTTDASEQFILLRSHVPDPQSLWKQVSSSLNEMEPGHVTPLNYWNLVYTGESNCERPDKLFEWATQLWQQHMKTFGKPNFNSMYSQLFTTGSSMAKHRDEYGDWGISICLGASCEFQFGKRVLTLHSGDILMGNFKIVQHAVLQIHSDAPDWLPQGRCSIQIREVPTLKEHLSMNEFRKRIK